MNKTRLLRRPRFVYTEKARGGGGSVIDCCKAVSMAAVYEGDAAMAGNRILKLGKRTDFQCRRMGNQLAADENTELKQIADSCMLSAGNGR